jgi:hypothetical protein
MNTTFSEGLPVITTKKMNMEHKQANAIATAFIAKTKYATTDREKNHSNEKNDLSPDCDEKVVTASKYHEALMKSNQ